MGIVSAKRWGFLFRNVEKTPTLLVLVVACACTSAMEPEPPPSTTLLVTNATCGTGECSSFQVRGIWAHQPVATPGGPWAMDLGTVSSASVCLTLPSVDTFRVNGTPYIWTSRDSLTLGILQPGEPGIPATSSTAAFVPANSAGWSITLPGGAAVTPANACG